MIRFLTYLLAGVCLVQAPNFHSAYVSFEITHLGVLTVEGSLGEINGSIKKVSQSIWEIAGEIDVKSIRTGEATRDETILNKQYLNVTKYPFIPFKGKVIKERSGNFKLKVEAQIRGLSVNFETCLQNVRGFLVSEPTVINRKNIGLDFGAMDTLIGDDITIQVYSGISESYLLNQP